MGIEGKGVIVYLIHKCQWLCLVSFLLVFIPALADSVPAPAVTLQVQAQPQLGITPLAYPPRRERAESARVICPVEDWLLWTEFQKFFVNLDGRVVYSLPPKADSASEAQAYAMFFSLIANDPINFEKIWRWTVRNMFANDLDSRLPAWLWGQAEDGTWKVLDGHSASDADVWFAYILLEAGRLWERPDYVAEGNKVLATIEKYLILDLPNFGKMLSWGRMSFVEPDNIWRLNPSYMPIPLLRRLAKGNPRGPWSEIASNTLKLIQRTSPKGYAADWVSFERPPKGLAHFSIDKLAGDRGSYDAIRVYLWAGMTHKDDPLAAPLLKALPGMLSYITLNGSPPESVEVTTGAAGGKAPYGFAAAVLPYLKSLGANRLFLDLENRARSMQIASATDRTMYPERPPYYNYSLSMFAFGWVEGRYQWLKDGQLKFKWEQSCSYAAVR